jgi:UspA1-like protein
MRTLLLIFLLAFLAYSTTYSLEPVRCAVSYTGGGAVIVEVQLHDYGTGTNIYPGFGHKNIGLFTANSSGIISFVIGSGDAAWTSISASNITNNYMVNVYIGGAIAAYCRIDQMIVEQGIYGSSIDASVISLPDGEIFVGDADGDAVSLAISGDATMDNAGAFTVTGLQGKDIHDAAPTDGQVLAWDNTNSRWAPASGGGAFSTASNVTSNSPGTLATDDFVFGSDQLDDDGNTDHDARFFFDKSKSAFRAGKATGTQWDDANIGLYSFATGRNNIASDPFSTVSGGSDNTASEVFSVVSGGNENTASGENSTVCGGFRNTASGIYSTVSGGNENTASGAVSTVSGGWDNTASGYYSTISGGSHNTAASYGETVMGIYSTEAIGTSNSFVATDRLFNVGNGSHISSSDAFTILKNANTTIGGSLTFNNNGTNTSVTLPTVRGTNGHVLTTDGTGGTSWAAAAGGGSSALTFNTYNSNSTINTDNQFIIIDGPLTINLPLAPAAGQMVYYHSNNITAEISGNGKLLTDGVVSAAVLTTDPSRGLIIYDGTIWRLIN